MHEVSALVGIRARQQLLQQLQSQNIVPARCRIIEKSFKAFAEEESAVASLGNVTFMYS